MGGGRDGVITGVIGASAICGIVRFMCISTVGVGPESGDGGIMGCCPVHSGCERPELCMLPPMKLQNSLRLRPQSAVQGLGFQDHRHHLSCSHDSASSVCSGPPTFRQADVCNSPVPWCVGQKHLCSVMDDLLAVD